jgi:DNA-directed RNA polymerase specialized sigma24 family protein
MKLPPKITSRISREERYSTTDDFRDLFAKEMSTLFQFAHLLTADEQMAEQCVLSSLRDCLSSTSVFRERAYKWARRVIIRNAIRIVQIGTSGHPVGRAAREAPDIAFAQPKLRSLLVPAILSLPNVERFAFVLAVLEGYSNREAGILIGCSSQEVQEEKIRAAHQVGIGESLMAPFQSIHWNSGDTYL